MKKMYKPLWSFDVQKTEQWLSGMAEKGLAFDRLNHWTRCFYFQEHEPETRVYRIAYDKMSSSELPSTLKDEGWNKTATAGKWQFSVNNHLESTIRTSPIREGIIKHNRMITYIFYGIIFYVAGILLANSSMLVSSWRQDGGIDIVESPLWILTFLFFTIILGSAMLGIYSIVKINRTNKELEETGIFDTVSVTDQRNKLAEKELKKAGRWVTKLKLAWMYSPDKMEQWLESMELRGFHLYRVNQFGTIFHFIKGEPRRIAYGVDYQSGPTQSYFAIHQEAGWNEKFASFSTIEKWTIWSKAYGKDQERPQLYSNQSSRLKHSKKIAITYTVVFLPFVSFYVYLIIGNISRSQTISDWLSWNSAGLLVIVIFGTFICRIWAYYGRLRKEITA